MTTPPAASARIADVHRWLIEGSTDCVTLCRMAMERINKYDRSGPKLRGVISINEHAEREAQLLDEMASSRRLLPLHGVPVLLKDNIDTHDMATTGGAVALAERRPADDATVAARLREAGAVIVGKANLSELARSGLSSSSLGGQARNPYDLNRTPGGSSGGSGAGVAAGYAVAALGTDTGQSVRSPASANALVGIRPTNGLVSRHGVIPVSWTRDAVGPIARCVADAALMLEVIAGYDPKDRSTAWGAAAFPALRASSSGHSRLAGVRLGSVVEFVGDQPEHEIVNASYEAFNDLLQALGATIVEVELGRMTDLSEQARQISDYEWGPALDAYLATTNAGGATSLRQIYEDGRYDRSYETKLLRALEVTDPRDDPDYLQAIEARRQLRDELIDLFIRDDLDALIYPHQRQLVAAIGEPQRERNGTLASGVGFPAITVPAPAPTAVPIGMEFLGRPFSEPALLTLAATYEQHITPPTPPDLARPR